MSDTELIAEARRLANGIVAETSAVEVLIKLATRLEEINVAIEALRREHDKDLSDRILEEDMG